MAIFRILVLVSKTEIRSMEFSFSSRSLRMRIINFDLVSMPAIGGDFFLGIVSKPDIKCQKFSVSSRCARLNQRNSHSRFENEKMTLADLCFTMHFVKGSSQINSNTKNKKLPESLNAIPKRYLWDAQNIKSRPLSGGRKIR